MYHYEPNYYFHCQMDLNGPIEDYISDRKIFTDLQSLFTKLNYNWANTDKLSILTREENDIIFRHKLLINDKFVLCSFDYEFLIDLPEYNNDPKLLIINNPNVTIPYSKYCRDKYDKYGTIYNLKTKYK